MPKIDPIRPTDDDARAQARALVARARFAALGVLEPDTGAPMVTRVALGTEAGGTPITLISALSGHTTALRVDPACSLLVGEPGDKGEPLTHPRLTLQCRATFVAREDDETLRARWLDQHPKAALYIGFADFAFVRFTVVAAFLNGGFGKAFRLTPEDLAL